MKEHHRKEVFLKVIVPELYIYFAMYIIPCDGCRWRELQSRVNSVISKCTRTNTAGASGTMTSRHCAGRRLSCDCGSVRDRLPQSRTRRIDARIIFGSRRSCPRARVAPQGEARAPERERPGREREPFDLGCEDLLATTHFLPPSLVQSYPLCGYMVVPLPLCSLHTHAHAIADVRIHTHIHTHTFTGGEKRLDGTSLLVTTRRKGQPNCARLSLAWLGMPQTHGTLNHYILRENYIAGVYIIVEEHCVYVCVKREREKRRGGGVRGIIEWTSKVIRWVWKGSANQVSSFQRRSKDWPPFALSL